MPLFLLRSRHERLNIYIYICMYVCMYIRGRKAKSRSECLPGSVWPGGNQATGPAETRSAAGISPPADGTATDTPQSPRVWKRNTLRSCSLITRFPWPPSTRSHMLFHVSSHWGKLFYPMQPSHADTSCVIFFPYQSIIQYPDTSWMSYSSIWFQLPAVRTDPAWGLSLARLTPTSDTNHNQWVPGFPPSLQLGYKSGVPTGTSGLTTGWLTEPREPLCFHLPLYYKGCAQALRCMNSQMTRFSGQGLRGVWGQELCPCRFGVHLQTSRCSPAQKLQTPQWMGFDAFITQAWWIINSISSPPTPARGWDRPGKLKLEASITAGFLCPPSSSPGASECSLMRTEHTSTPGNPKGFWRSVSGTGVKGQMPELKVHPQHSEHSQGFRSSAQETGGQRSNTRSLFYHSLTSAQCSFITLWLQLEVYRLVYMKCISGKLLPQDIQEAQIIRRISCLWIQLLGSCPQMAMLLMEFRHQWPFIPEGLSILDFIFLTFFLQCHNCTHLIRVSLLFTKHNNWTWAPLSSIMYLVQRLRQVVKYLLKEMELWNT